jgi:acyl-CoA synthetase (AMP-forming)/AMP-acid ligase II
VPPILNFLAKSPTSNNLNSLRILCNSASGASPEICEEIKRKFNVIIGQGYGMSELSFLVFLPVFTSKNKLSSGRLCTHMEAKIVDIHDDKEGFKKLVHPFIQLPILCLGIKLVNCVCADLY